MKTKILDIQEFNTSLGILRIETRISEENNFRSVVENKIVYNGDDDITFVNTKISNQGTDYNKNALVGGLVEFRTTGDISFSGDRVDTGSGAFINSTVLSDILPNDTL